jgi:hypothetical protein
MGRRCSMRLVCFIIIVIFGHLCGNQSERIMEAFKMYNANTHTLEKDVKRREKRAEAKLSHYKRG